MTRPDSWRLYEPLADVSLPDLGKADLYVAAKIDGDDLTRPIRLDMLSAVDLTLEQSAALRATLERAEADVRSGVVEADPQEVTCG